MLVSLWIREASDPFNHSGRYEHVNGPLRAVVLAYWHLVRGRNVEIVQWQSIAATQEPR